MTAMQLRISQCDQTIEANRVRSCKKSRAERIQQADHGAIVRLVFQYACTQYPGCPPCLAAITFCAADQRIAVVKQDQGLIVGTDGPCHLGQCQQQIGTFGIGQRMVGQQVDRRLVHQIRRRGSLVLRQGRAGGLEYRDQEIPDGIRVGGLLPGDAGLPQRGEQRQQDREHEAGGGGDACAIAGNELARAVPTRRRVSQHGLAGKMTPDVLGQRTCRWIALIRFLRCCLACDVIEFTTRMRHQRFDGSLSGSPTSACG